MQRVPTSVKVISILGFVFTFYDFFGLIVSVAFLWGSGFLGPNPMLDKINSDPGYLIGTGITLAIGFLLMVLLLASSIGGLLLKPWARVGMLVYAWLTILHGVGGLIFAIVYVIPLMLSALAPNDPARVGAMVGAAGSSCGGLIGLIFPGFVIYFYTRPHVIDAFRGIFPPHRRDLEDEDDYNRRGFREDERDDRRYPDSDSDQITNRPG